MLIKGMKLITKAGRSYGVGAAKAVYKRNKPEYDAAKKRVAAAGK